MASARSCFGKFRSKDEVKASKKKETISSAKTGSKAPASDEAPSSATKLKVEAAKQYIEKHYKEQMKNLEERKERYDLHASFSSNDEFFTI